MDIPDPWTLLIMMMAVWRITSLLVFEAGPWGMFSWLREKAGIEYDEFGDIIPGSHRLLEALGCLLCLSLWTAALWSIIYLLLGEGVIVALSLPFCLSMGAIIIQRLMG